MHPPSSLLEGVSSGQGALGSDRGACSVGGGASRGGGAQLDEERVGRGGALHLVGGRILLLDNVLKGRLRVGSTLYTWYGGVLPSHPRCCGPSPE